VNVRIDQARKDRGIAEIPDFGVFRNLMGSDYFEDAVSFDQQSGGTHGVRRYNTAGNEGAETHRERRIRRKSLLMETRA
jgi:hypothetical protein